MMLGKLRILFWIGVVTLFVPYLGITSGIKTALTIVIGVILIYLSFRLRKGYKELRFRLRRLEEPATSPEVTTESQ